MPEWALEVTVVVVAEGTGMSAIVSSWSDASVSVSASASASATSKLNVASVALNVKLASARVLVSSDCTVEINRPHHHSTWLSFPPLQTPIQSR
eukprot:COSAG02_NODE_34719_length_479_cov_1.234211_1_plen_93_part_01